MSDFNQYQVDHEVSDKIVELLRKCAGNDPDDRMIAYDRMREILDYEIKQEQKRARDIAAQEYASGPHCPVCSGPLPCDCTEMLDQLAGR